MAIAKKHVDSALMPGHGASDSCWCQHVPMIETDSAKKAVTNRHHIGGNGHFGFIDRRKTREPRRKCGS